MTIRMLEPTDHEQWLPLWKAYQAFYQVDIRDEVTRLTWQRLLDPDEPMHCAVADVDGALIGMVHYIYHRSCWSRGDYCYLQDLYAVPAVRGQGIGRALIEHVYVKAEENSAARVWWLTHESNHTAMHLYDRIADKSGFVQYRKVMP